MWAYTPFSRARPPQRVCLPVSLLWTVLLVIIFPSCPPSHREPAPVTRGRLRLHPPTPPHLRKAPGLHSRGRLLERPSMSQIPLLSTDLIIHRPRNIRAPRRMWASGNFIIRTNIREPGHPDGPCAHQIPRSLLTGETLRRNLSGLSLSIRIRTLTLLHIWIVIAEANTIAQRPVEPKVEVPKKRGGWNPSSQNCDQKGRVSNHSHGCLFTAGAMALVGFRLIAFFCRLTEVYCGHRSWTSDDLCPYHVRYVSRLRQDCMTWDKI
jgi:hypothetical protein